MNDSMQRYPHPRPEGGTRLTDIFVKRPVLSIVVILLILLIGARAMFSLPIYQYPKLYNTVITLNTVCPADSAKLMHEFKTNHIEQTTARTECTEHRSARSSARHL